jgi:hypothetical protein
MSLSMTKVRLLALLLVVGVAVMSCGDGGLSLDQWEQEWQDTVGRIEEMRSSSVSEQQCEETIGYLREQRPLLTPPPLSELDDPVDSWFDLTEDALFECRFEGAPGTSQSQLFDTLDVFETEVDTILSLER